MPTFIPARGRTLHVAGVCINRIGKVRSVNKGGWTFGAAQSQIPCYSHRFDGRRRQEYFRALGNVRRWLRETARNIAGRRQRQSDGDRACALEGGAVAVDQAFFQGPQDTQRKGAEGVRALGRQTVFHPDVARYDRLGQPLGIATRAKIAPVRAGGRDAVPYPGPGLPKELFFGPPLPSANGEFGFLSSDRPISDPPYPVSEAADHFKNFSSHV